MSHHEDAQLILQIYDLRREARLREARAFVTGRFKAKDMDELNKICPPGSEENAYFRQIVSYWEMSASLVLQGAVHPDLFLDWSGEMMFFFAKFQPILKDVREATKNPGFFGKVEAVINQGNRQEAVAAMVERQKAMSAGAK